MFDAQTADRPAAPEVRGELLCPRPDEVAEALDRVLGPSLAGQARDVAELREEGGFFVILLRRASGEIVGEKRVPASLACAVRAEVAAVSLAAMESRLASGDALPLPVAPAAAAPSGPATPAAAATPVVPSAPEAPVPRRETPSGAPLAPLAITATAPTRSAPVPVEASAAALLSLNGADVAPAARVELVARPGRSRWGLSVAATIEGTHRADVAPGEARWWRWGGEVAVSRGLGPWRGARIDARAGVALTAVELEGHGFSENGGARLLDPGAAAAVRLVPFAWRARPWVEVSGAVWPRGHELSVTGAGSTAQLPRGELLLGIGAAFGAPP